MCLRLSHRLPCTGSLLLPILPYTLHFLLQYLQPLDPILRIYMYTLLSSLSSDWISSVLLFRIPGFRIPAFLMMCLRLSHRLLCTCSWSVSMLLCRSHFPLQHSIQVSIRQMCTWTLHLLPLLVFLHHSLALFRMVPFRLSQVLYRLHLPRLPWMFCTSILRTIHLLKGYQQELILLLHILLRHRY